MYCTSSLLDLRTSLLGRLGLWADSLSLSFYPFSLSGRRKEKKHDLRSVSLIELTPFLVICMFIYYPRSQYVFFNILPKIEDLFDAAGHKWTKRTKAVLIQNVR